MDTPDHVIDRAGVRVLLCAPDGPVVGGEADAVELVGLAASGDAAVVVVPVERLDPAFFRLRTGVAGAVVQKFAIYRLRLAVLGDVSAHTDRSPTLRAFVTEA